MHLLITDAAFKDAKSRQLIPLQCRYCTNTFYKCKSQIQRAIKAKNGLSNHFHRALYCNLTCFSNQEITKITVSCMQCNTLTIKTPFQIKKSPNNFCSRSCSATYNNKRRKNVRRSKAELYLIHLIQTKYPDITIKPNYRSALISGLELDLFLPDYNIAIELNGIVHFHPIYGEEKLNKIKNNDLIKMKECIAKSINLFVVDISNCKTFETTKDVVNSFFKDILSYTLDKIVI